MALLDVTFVRNGWIITDGKRELLSVTPQLDPHDGHRLIDREERFAGAVRDALMHTRRPPGLIDRLRAALRDP